MCPPPAKTSSSCCMPKPALMLHAGQGPYTYMYRLFPQENPRRPLQIFKLDALKNGLGASLAHFMNIFIGESPISSPSCHLVRIYFHLKPPVAPCLVLTFANSFAAALRLAGTADPCPWYLIQIVLDTTVVVFANFVMLRWFEGWLMSLWNLDVTSGDYGEPPDTKRWLQQLGVWFIVVFVCKVAFAFVLVAGHAQLSVIASLILSPLCFNPHLELFIVVVFLPLILNAFSFWMMDSFLKYTDDKRAYAGSREGKRRNNTALTEAFGGHVDYGATGL